MKQWLNKNFLVKKLILNGLLSLVCAIVGAVIITGHLWQIQNVKCNIINLRVWLSLNRAFILFFALFFIGLHFILPVKQMYNWIFDKRWVMGLALLLFLTANRYHGDSISYYNEIIQPGMGDDSAVPIFGGTRGVRTDEFVVNTPSVLASGYGDTPYGKYNEVMRGTKTLNVITGVYAGYVTLAYAPWELSYLVFPREYAFSFCWYAPIILGFLMTLELFYIITKRQKLVSVTGTFLVIFSSFYLWWVFSMQIISTAGTVVCLYYFLDNHRISRKIFCGIGMAICFSNFIINFYPAWQVPFGYMFLAVGIWVLHENWEAIKKFRLKEWSVIVGALILMVSFVIAYFCTAAEYVETISSTVYPGERIDTGSFGLLKIFNYAQAPFYAYQDIGNASEAGVFFSLFPIPTIMAIYCFIKEKNKDWLTGGLLLAQIPMLFYVTVGFPEIVAKLSLFSHTTTIRVIDIIGLIQVYFVVIILSHYKEIVKLPKAAAGVLGIVTAIVCIRVSGYMFPGYLNFVQKVVMFFVVTAACICLMVELGKKARTVFLFGLIGISIYTGIYVRPIMKGLAAIYSKPAAKEIMKICEEDVDAKWITIGMDIGLPAFCTACGAPTVNSVNVYPNLELWKKLDPDGKFDEIYNRYAHIDVAFTDQETNFEKIQEDYIRLNLAYEDIEKTGVDYLVLAGEANLENDYVDFKQIYDENGISIYCLNY